jgi:uncharacterized Fe-S center protein
MKFRPPFSRRTETHFILLDTSHCKACWECVDICPQHVLGKIDFHFHRHACIDRAENCKGCLRCLKACSNQAILTKEKPYDNTPR